MCALLDTDNKAFSIPKFIRRLLSEYARSEWKEFITKEELQELQKSTSNLQKSKIFTLLNNLRNKQYSRIDYKNLNENNTISHKDVMSLVNTITSVVSILNNKIFCIGVIDFFHKALGHYVLEELSKFNQFKKIIKKKKRENLDSIATEDLEKILKKDA